MNGMNAVTNLLATKAAQVNKEQLNELSTNAYTAVSNINSYKKDAEKWLNVLNNLGIGSSTTMTEACTIQDEEVKMNLDCLVADLKLVPATTVKKLRTKLAEVA